MKALIDGDIIVYRVGYTTNLEDLPIALARCDEMIQGILQGVSATSYEIYLSDSVGNFRNNLYTEYKKNRKQEKPVWYTELKEYLIEKYRAKISIGQEADDALGIEQLRYAHHYDDDGFDFYYWDKGEETIICSIDKDLLQIPGDHYNFVKQVHVEISPYGGRYHFYHQVLTGDVSDNVPGIYGVGPVKAEKILHGCYTELEMFSKVREAYKNDALLLLTGQLLKIRTKEEEIWKFPIDQTELLLPSMENQSLSIPQKPEEATQSTEPTSQGMNLSLG